MTIYVLLSHLNYTHLIYTLRGEGTRVSANVK